MEIIKTGFIAAARMSEQMASPVLLPLDFENLKDFFKRCVNADSGKQM